jgi:DNA-binding PucR family transcriptional regulator
VIGPARPWLQVAGSFERARRAWLLGLAGAAARTSAGRLVDTEDVLPELLVGADLAALADLRARVLAPLSGLRPATAERLAETLRAWLLHRGRREEVAAALFVHPQTVRYRVGQLRALFGDALDDPRMTLELTLALALPGSALPGPVLPGPALPGPVATPEPPA